MRSDDIALSTFFQKRSENSIFYGFQTQARSHEPIFGDRKLIFGVNVTHWWDIENQNFGGDPMTLPFLRFLRKQMSGTLTLPPLAFSKNKEKAKSSDLRQNFDSQCPTNG